MFLNKTEVLNGALENIPSSYAYDLWNRMGNNCDGYSLNFMLQKGLKIFGASQRNLQHFYGKVGAARRRKARPN